jgi:hypothetical protein
LRGQIESEDNVLTRARRAPAERKRDETVALYHLYRLFRKGGCNAVKQVGLYGGRLAFDPPPSKLPDLQRLTFPFNKAV